MNSLQNQIDPRHRAPAFEVHPYSLPTLIELAARLSAGTNTEEAIAAKTHPGYLDRHFKTLKVKTIVVERPYIDRDYLDDFAAYYVRCFQHYERHCARLHFFTADFDTQAFRSLLWGDKKTLPTEMLCETYCGFIVIKPLPRKVFGRTCLRASPAEQGRQFPVARTFSATLFGIHLEVPETLPFQEQDNVVAACATSALWSALQATAREFEHLVLTPVEITRAATDFLLTDQRMIPNREGLSAEMIAEAIRAVGLEPVKFAVPELDHVTLRATLYAYLKARIPIILGIQLCDIATDADAAVIGNHAVTVTGFKLEAQVAPALDDSGFRLRAARMSEIYVHDDQVGPFARMAFEESAITVDMEDRRGIVPVRALSSSWGAHVGGASSIRAVPVLLFMPLYHKIRILYEDIADVALDFHRFLVSTLSLNMILDAGHLEWDIYLTTVNDLKSDLQQRVQLHNGSRLHWLTQSMPRFIWRVTARLGEKYILDILFDATDIHISDGVHGVLCYEEALCAALTHMAANPDDENLNQFPGARRILHGLRKNDVDLAPAA